MQQLHYKAQYVTGVYKIIFVYPEEYRKHTSSINKMQRLSIIKQAVDITTTVLKGSTSISILSPSYVYFSQVVSLSDMLSTDST